MTVGMCPEHSRIWREDIAFGLHKRNRLRAIVLEREIQFTLKGSKANNLNQQLHYERT